MGLRGEIPQKVKSSPFSISKLKLSGQQCMYQGMLKEAMFPIPLPALPPQPGSELFFK